jgi:hypothetical protein
MDCYLADKWPPFVHILIQMTTVHTLPLLFVEEPIYCYLTISA